MMGGSVISCLYIILFFISLDFNIVQSMEYNDCTEEISTKIIAKNNGTLQFEYMHYPGFWLSHIVKQNKKILQWSFHVKEENFDSSSSQVGIMDTNSHSYVDARQDRHVGYLWSWNIASK